MESGELVEVRGEVRFPGDYLIRRGETIAEIIARAGGLTKDAFPRGTIFTRVEVARLENERAAELAGTIRANVATSMLTQETRLVDFAEIGSGVMLRTFFSKNVTRSETTPTGLQSRDSPQTPNNTVDLSLEFVPGICATM